MLPSNMHLLKPVAYSSRESNQSQFAMACPGCAKESALEAVGGTVAPKPGEGGRPAPREAASVPRAKRVPTVWFLADAPAFGLRRVYRRFGPCALGFQVSGFKSQFYSWWFFEARRGCLSQSRATRPALVAPKPGVGGSPSNASADYENYETNPT